MTEIRYPNELPIVGRREEILAALKAYPVLIIAGETGSGKTTQLPKMCLEAGLAEKGKIGCTQPRRVAAMSVSRRVAEELGVTWGQEVGCKMRFNDDTGRNTRIKFMTDGILLAEIQSDPSLRAYSTLILDEAHERSLNIDFLLGYLQGLLRRRTDLKVIITSATIDTEAFSQAFGGAPIIQVSGRLFPVEIRYHPITAKNGAVGAETAGSRGDVGEGAGLIESTVRAVEEALIETDAGDVLVFMPTERDIRETRDVLEGSLGAGIEVLGLFGRLAGAEQQRIFSPGDRRRVIVATNIAETSLTIPRIGTVIDTGLVRMSRYNPRTRTKRLPVEDISQSSANQRAGRAGRLRDGVCIRLYSQEDYEKRPLFTQPEIQRANLAEVILRMKAFRLGEVESFPFLSPPLPQSIRAGYQLLQELGALSETHDLTALGRELARLPVDPTLGRMLLQARTEGALPEMLIIAAGLSIPDPRERPEEEKEAAAAAHRAFAHPDSDFLTLLNLWRLAPGADGRSGANVLRRFCKTNYVSLSRMREWRDVHKQLEQSVEDRVAPLVGRTQGSDFRSAGRAVGALIGVEAKGQNGSNAAVSREGTEVEYETVHRSILAGLLGQIGQRQERNLYKASADRVVSLFPGSGLYERQAKKVKVGARPDSSGGEGKSVVARQPQWVVAGEIVQTSQLFARTAARIDPQWVISLGEHLCDFRYMHPQWSAKAGRVLVWERVLIHGLELSKRQVDYGRINAVEATELFIRGALVAGEARISDAFYSRNRSLREKIESALTRVRSNRVQDLDEAFYSYYAARIENVSSIHDLNRLLKGNKDPEFLCATDDDLLGDGALEYDRQLFPDQVSLGNTVIPLTYAYSPGAEGDGVTLRVPLPLAERLSAAELQWMVPGLREEQTGVLLRALPKSVRKQLMPIEPKIREVVSEFKPGNGDLLKALAEFLDRKYGVTVRAEDWKDLPDYLRPRVVVVDRHNRAVGAGRDLDHVRASMSNRGVQSDAWDRMVREFEKAGVRRWSFGDLAQSVVVEEVGGAPLLGYPGLILRPGTGGGSEVDLRLFRKQIEAQEASGAAVRRLAELVMEREMNWLAKEMRALGRQLLGISASSGKSGQGNRAGFGEALGGFGQKVAAAGESEFGSLLHMSEQLPVAGVLHVIEHVFNLSPVYPLHESRFEVMLEAARRDLPSLAHRVGDLTRQIVDMRKKTLVYQKRYPGMADDVERLVPVDFLARTPHGRLVDLLRYLRAIQIRAERASVSPLKDSEKARQMGAFSGWQQLVPAVDYEAFRWLLEEFRVSLFAQELGTAQPVSIQRLKALGGF